MLRRLTLLSCINNLSIGKALPSYTVLGAVLNQPLSEYKEILLFKSRISGQGQSYSWYAQLIGVCNERLGYIIAFSYLLFFTLPRTHAFSPKKYPLQATLTMFFTFKKAGPCSLIPSLDYEFIPSLGFIISS